MLFNILLSNNVKVKEVIFRNYDINEETYRWRFRSVMFKENKTLVELD